MRRPRLCRLAMAMLRRAGGGAYGEAMRGDLLEEFARTGSAGRFWRDVLRETLRGVWRRGGMWAQPVVFSVGWCLLYPAWQAIEGGRVWPGLAQRSYAMDWPYSSVALLASAGLPPLLFVWCGALLYMARNQRAESGWVERWFEVVRGLSLSLSVLLLSWIVLMRSTQGEGMGRQVDAGRGVSVSWLTVCLGLSLLAATGSVNRTQASLRAR